jgi:hypothetical protein
VECGHCDSPPGRADHIDFKVEYGVTEAHSPGSREFSFTINFHPGCPGEKDHTRQNRQLEGLLLSLGMNEAARDVVATEWACRLSTTVTGSLG